jgi:ABC-2 type transport system permease protein
VSASATSPTSGVPGSAPRSGRAWRPLVAQARTELLLSARQGEQILVAIGIPLLILVFFSLVDVLPTGTDDPIDQLAPAVLALAIMSTAMVSLGIATGFERYYGVLKRLGATPLGRPRLLGAKLVAVLAVEVLQLVVLVVVARLLDWHPQLQPLGLVAAVLLGTAAFAGLGLALAGLLSGPANLAACNGLYLVLLLLGGVAVPASELPSALGAVARALPSGALVDVMVDVTGGPASARAWLVLVAWAVALPTLTAATFRWSPD